jgi:hypothetical protein
MANYPEIELYIDGRWKRASGQPVINPADESVLGTVPTATTADLDDALAAAERGFVTWRKTSPAKRMQIILKAASLIRQRVDDMAIAMTLEQGKPIDPDRPGPAGGLARVRHHRMGRHRGVAVLWARHPKRRRHAPYGSAAADRSRGGILALEFSDELAREKGRGRIVLRLFDHSQGFGGNAGRSGAVGAGLSRRRAAARGSQSGVR